MSHIGAGSTYLMLTPGRAPPPISVEALPAQPELPATTPRDESSADADAPLVQLHVEPRQPGSSCIKVNWRRRRIESLAARESDRLVLVPEWVGRPPAADNNNGDIPLDQFKAIWLRYEPIIPMSNGDPLSSRDIDFDKLHERLQSKISTEPFPHPNSDDSGYWMYGFSFSFSFFFCWS